METPENCLLDMVNVGFVFKTLTSRSIWRKRKGTRKETMRCKRYNKEYQMLKGKISGHIFKIIIVNNWNYGSENENL